MRSSIFHLAIPCRDLEEAARFYVNQIGAELARTYDDRITLNFFGDQIVCHLAPDKIDQEPAIYPRHFGITLRDQAAFDSLATRFKRQGLSFFKEPFTRFADLQEEHASFFVKDPSNNLIEFKHYKDECMIF